MKEMNELNKGLRVLSDEETAAVSGGWHPFPRGVFGRDGKPFFGRDVVETAVPAIVKVGVSFIPGGAGPLATAAAAATKAVLVHNR